MLTPTNYSIATIDRMIGNLMSRRVPVSGLSDIWDEVNFWQDARRSSWQGPCRRQSDAHSH